jgi:hypothetical protein
MWNEFVEFHNLFVHDVFCHIDLWRFLHPDNKLTAPLMRHEMYSRVMGSFNGYAQGRPPAIPPEPATQRISSLRVYSGGSLDGLEVFHGTTSKGRIGALTGTPDDLVLAPGEYIKTLKLSASGSEKGSHIDNLFIETTTRQKKWGSYTPKITLSFDNMCLSSIHGARVQVYTKFAMVFGFKYADGYGDAHAEKPNMSLLRHLYEAAADKVALYREVQSRWQLGHELRDTAKREGWQKWSDIQNM